MVYDFGLLKGDIRSVIDSFDHSVAIWKHDNADYIESVQKHSERWVVIPVSPSAEQFSRVIFFLVDKILKSTEMKNGESLVSLHSVIVHETETGYAQCFRGDVENSRMGILSLDQIEFSEKVVSEWSDPTLLEQLKLKDIKPDQSAQLSIALGLEAQFNEIFK